MLVGTTGTAQIVTIIPARGGSKGIKKKNIRLLNGKPLLCYSIEYSLKSPLVKRTIVSTDDLEIADIAEKCGADVPFIRPEEYAQDDTPDYPVFKHAADWLKKHEGKVFDFFVLLRPTSPLRPDGLIEKGYHLLMKYPDASSVRTVALCRQHPYRMFKIKGNFLTSVVNDGILEPYNIPRQKLPDVYFQTGDMEMMRRKALLEENSISGKKILPLMLHEADMIDIDEEKDFVSASDRLKSTIK